MSLLFQGNYLKRRGLAYENERNVIAASLTEKLTNKRMGHLPGELNLEYCNKLIKEPTENPRGIKGGRTRTEDGNAR